MPSPAESGGYGADVDAFEGAQPDGAFRLALLPDDHGCLAARDAEEELVQGIGVPAREAVALLILSPTDHRFACGFAVGEFTMFFWVHVCFVDIFWGDFRDYYFLRYGCYI